MVHHQREQLIDTMGLVREMGKDLFHSGKIANDIHRRRLLTICILYMVIMLLAGTISMIILNRVFNYKP